MVARGVTAYLLQGCQFMLYTQVRLCTLVLSERMSACLCRGPLLGFASPKVRVPFVSNDVAYILRS